MAAMEEKLKLAESAQAELSGAKQSIVSLEKDTADKAAKIAEMQEKLNAAEGLASELENTKSRLGTL